ncbi:MAG: thiamine-phosphate kinase [Blastocatellia bacterium]
MRSEFDFIHNIKKKYSLNLIGDDCAVLPKDDKTDMVITADMLVEDIDFRLEWTTPELLGAKTLAVSLSDIAAMGAEPEWAMLSIGIPANIWNDDFVDRFYEGWFTLAKHHKVELVGGDISRTPDKIVIDCIVAGEVSKGKAILRSGASPGDSIFVTGALGGAAGGLMLLESGFRYAEVDESRKKLITRQLRPTPQIAAGKYLAANDIATAMIDISDGLASDLQHLCEASGVGALIDLESIPRDPNLSAISATDDVLIGLATGGGEDFELLFTSQEKSISDPEIPEIHRIGEITTGARKVIVNGFGFEGCWPRKGWRHF